MGKVNTGHDFLSYNSDKATQKLLMDKVVGFFKEHKSFTGVHIVQDDACQLDAADFLADVADEVFCFKRVEK